MFNDEKKNQITVKAVLCLMAALLFPPQSWALNKRRAVGEGNVLYQKEDYKAAIEKYKEALKKDSESDIINFNLGTAYYKAKDYQKAIEHLEKALLSEKKDLQQKAHYNAGNALFRKGMSRTEDDIAAAIQDLEKALAQYEQSLGIRSEDEDVQYNYDFVKKELERLRQKNEQQDQSKGQSSSSESEQKQEEGSQNQNESAQERQKQEQQNEGAREDQQKEESEREEMGGEKGQPQKSGEQKDSQGSPQPKEYNAQELTPEEAKQLLENYRQTEEPRGMLRFHRLPLREKPVEKDW